MSHRDKKRGKIAAEAARRLVRGVLPRGEQARAGADRTPSREPTKCKCIFGMYSHEKQNLSV